MLCIHRSFASDKTLSHEGPPSSDYLVSAAHMGSLSDTVPKLFQPIKVGDMTLGHRVVMAPLTRGRATKKHVHTDIAVTYYAQRASVPGTLIIAEATFIAPRAGLYDHVPGVWNNDQIAAWKKASDSHYTSISCRGITFVAIDYRRDTREGVIHIPSTLGAWTRCGPRSVEGGEPRLPVRLLVGHSAVIREERGEATPAHNSGCGIIDTC